MKDALLGLLGPARRKALSGAYARLRRSSTLFADGRRERWLREVYSERNNRIRRELFLDIAHFCQVSRPYRGYYFEFGCHSARTMRMAWDSFRHLFDFRYVAFDSFEGLPEIRGIDRQEIWQKGKLKTAESEFRRVCEAHGMPGDRLITVPGFYNVSLTPELRDRLLPAPAAIAYIDCDLYESTVPVLEFLVPFLVPGTVVVFDEWNAFNADPRRGERRAMREFAARHPEFAFEPLWSIGMHQVFVVSTAPAGAIPQGASPK